MAELELPFLSPGSRRWLIAKERHYGGIVTGVKIGRVSPRDPRGPASLAERSMTGGDRMGPRANNYASEYAHYLREFIGKSDPVCVEVGILRGTGLAIWSDLFPDGQIIGLDIDLSHFQANESRLRKLGAFKSNNVTLHEFDQFDCSSDSFERILNGRTIDIMIDDGFHSDDAVLSAFSAAVNHLSARYVYFIEDNDTLPIEQIRALAPKSLVQRYGRLTVIKGGTARVI